MAQFSCSSVQFNCRHYIVILFKVQLLLVRSVFEFELQFSSVISGHALVTLRLDATLGHVRGLLRPLGSLRQHHATSSIFICLCFLCLVCVPSIRTRLVSSRRGRSTTLLCDRGRSQWKIHDIALRLRPHTVEDPRLCLAIEASRSGRSTTLPCD